jgi:large subunit ribosomal protein L53
MMTKYLTEITARINPFNKRARSARVLLSLVGGEARARGLLIRNVVLPRASQEPPVLELKFSPSPPSVLDVQVANGEKEDGKELKMDLRVARISDIVDEVDRHSRMLARKEDLYG